ncbi:MAG: DUF4169 family protein [Pseudooceanicola sp.]|nr:DUF4169 family protein [Pseudooceanicola sp.]
MSEPVNLNKHRKAKARAEDKARADANAVKFGRTKGEKARDKAESARAVRELDGHKREP